MHILNNYVLLNILLLFVIKSNHHFQTERYLFFIFNPRTSRHWIINYSFQSRPREADWGWGNWRTWYKYFNYFYTLFPPDCTEPIVLFKLAVMSRSMCRAFHLNCSIRERRHSTQFGLRLKSELWHVGGGRVRHPAQPSPGHQKLICCREIPALSPLFSQDW